MLLRYLVAMHVQNYASGIICEKYGSMRFGTKRTYLSIHICKNKPDDSAKKKWCQKCISSNTAKGQKKGALFFVRKKRCVVVIMDNSFYNFYSR
jgi:hypothetical protein